MTIKSTLLILFKNLSSLSAVPFKFFFSSFYTSTHLRWDPVNRIIEHKSLLQMCFCITCFLFMSLHAKEKVHKTTSISHFSTHFHLFPHIHIIYIFTHVYLWTGTGSYITFMITLLLHFLPPFFVSSGLFNFISVPYKYHRSKKKRYETNERSV